MHVMIQPLRIGLIGGGANGAVGSSHVAAIRMDGNYNIGPCVFSHTQEENRHSHEVYGLPWSGHHASLSAWLDQNKTAFDVVALLTPSIDHAQQIEEIASRGISFITEKPVACSLLEVQAIEAVLSTFTGVEARFVHNYSGYPLFREMVLRLRAGRIGEIHSIRIEMPSDGFARECIIGKPQVWRQSDPQVPMIMLDLGTHMHHLVQMVSGKSKARVIARMHQLVNGLGVIDNVEIWEERMDGIRVSYWMSKAHLGTKNGLRIEVFGRDGALIWYQMDPDHLIEIDTDSNRTIVNRGAISAEATRHDRFKAGHPTGFVEAFASFYSDLAEDIRAAKDNAPRSRWICPIEDAFEGIRFLEAAARSHHTREWIDT
jgi:predicted dehydrogenase